MKLYILVCLLFASLAYAQEVAPPDPDATEEPTEVGSAERIPRCIVGTIVNMEVNITEVECAGEARACETKIEQRMNPITGQVTFRSVVRTCTSLEACQNNADGNTPKCYPGERNVRQCFFCCEPGFRDDGDLCNDSTDIPPAPTTPAPTPAA